MRQASETWVAAWRASLLGASNGHARATAEIAAGLIAALVTVSHCFSYTALMFSGSAVAALPYGLWALLAGAAVGCLVVALGSGVPPAMAGPRNAPIAVVSVLVATVASRLAATGASPDVIAANVLAALAIATGLTGLALWLIGMARLGSAVRFVPFPVIAGFLAASGWLLITGGLRVALGRPPRFADLMGGHSPTDLLRIAIAVAFVVVVEGLRRRGHGPGVLPLLFFAAAAALDLGLWLMDARSGWYLVNASGALPGLPLVWSQIGYIDAALLVSASAEIVTIAAVAVIGLLLDASALETQRRRIADMDQEFRTNGLANLVIVPLGGLVVGLAPNASRLIEQLGGRARLAGVSAAVGLAFVLLSGVDITALIPTPILGGLLMLLGLGVLWEALWPAPAHRSWSDLAMAVVIGAVIVHRGYLAGVILGLVAACLLFAVRYSRVGVIRRHVTRAALAAPVVRAAPHEAWLSAHGERIHVLWLAGYVFFGSSNGVFEDVRRRTGGDASQMRRWVVIDMSGVTGLDASAMLSFDKLRSWAAANDVVLCLTGVPRKLVRRFRVAGFIATSEESSVDSWTTALARCETELLSEMVDAPGHTAAGNFAGWLSRELGQDASGRLIGHYLSRRQLAPSATICAEGEAADTIDFVASGAIAISVGSGDGRTTVVRRMMVCTVVGEMGFFRNADRTASITAEGETVVYTLTRARYERMRQHDPELAVRLLEFVVRQLADRVEHANKTTSALL